MDKYILKLYTECRKHIHIILVNGKNLYEKSNEYTLILKLAVWLAYKL